MKMTKKSKILISISLIAIIIILSIIVKINLGKEKSTNAEVTLSNKKISWGIQRKNNHERPDVGKENEELINNYNGICLGNSEKKYIYLTFDLGYEAGYTEYILNSLKENNVQAVFFITAHYVNTASDLVQRMIDEGHIVGNHTPSYLMSRNDIKMKC